MCNFLLAYDFTVLLMLKLFGQQFVKPLMRLFLFSPPRSRFISLPTLNGSPTKLDIKLIAFTLFGDSNKILQLNSWQSHCKSDMVSHFSHLKVYFEAKLISRSSPKETVGLLNYLKSFSSSNQLPTHMTLNFVSVSSDQEKANLFNQFFFSVYTNTSLLPSLIGLQTHTPEAYIERLSISPKEVYQALAKLNPLKAKGIDGIGPMLVKRCASPLFRPIHFVFSQSLLYGSISQEWKVVRTSLLQYTNLETILP